MSESSEKIPITMSIVMSVKVGPDRNADRELEKLRGIVDMAIGEFGAEQLGPTEGTITGYLSVADDGTPTRMSRCRVEAKVEF